MLSYSYFADFYDELTQNVNYEEEAHYILKLAERYRHNMGITLDLACGTGTLTIMLKKLGVDIYGIDASAEMLSEAQEKAIENGIRGMLFLRQKMQSIDLYGTIDTCICTLDSINHITDIEDVQKTFSRVSFFMNPQALFIFDVNTVYKHQQILADNTFVYDTENVYCVWQNEYAGDGRVNIALDFFERQPDGSYLRDCEDFCEVAYSIEETKKMLAQAGLKVVAAYDDMTLEPPKGNSQRIVFVTAKL